MLNVVCTTTQSHDSLWIVTKLKTNLVYIDTNFAVFYATHHDFQTNAYDLEVYFMPTPHLSDKHHLWWLYKVQIFMFWGGRVGG